MNSTQLPRIPVCSARVDGNEGRYLQECIDTAWVSSSGPFVKRFEAAFADYVGTEFGVTASSGTASLHLALAALGVGPGDEVIVPALTMIASGNAVVYCGATPVIADVDPATGNLDPQQVARLMTPKTRAVMAVHLYGLPCDMGALRAAIDDPEVALVEDAAEAIGSTWQGVRAGALGDIAGFSFFANKVITTGEGGMVTTDREDLAKRVRGLKDQWFVPGHRFYHPDLGFNYRMSNLQAAVGMAQLERVEELAQARIDVAQRYRELLACQEWLELPPEAPEGSINSHWMYAVRVRPGAPASRRELAAFLLERNIDTRGFFVAMNRQPVFESLGASCPVAEDLGERGLLLPTGPTLTPADQERVAGTIRACFSR